MDNKYQEALLTSAKKLDKSSNGENQIVRLTHELIEGRNKGAIKDLFRLLSIILKLEDKHILQLSREFNECLLKYFGYQKLQEFFNIDHSIKSREENYSLSELLDQLNQLIGLEKVKSKILDLISYQKIQQLRKQNSLINPKNTLHLAFTGNPGTGKTTVARIVGRIYKELGLLTKGQFIEVSRTDLIAGYQGQTALKVKKVIEEAKGGVLFIDEAYSITENEHSDSYGKECLTELTKALEDYRDDLVVIVAGYTAPMNNFFNSNPGLLSRFNTFIEFDDYSENELFDILVSLLDKSDYILDSNLKNTIKLFFKDSIDNKTEQFANGRFVRNIYEDLIMKHASRVVKIEQPSLEELKKIIEVDFSVYLNN